MPNGATRAVAARSVVERRIRPVIATGYGYGMNSVGALASANGSSTHTETVPTNAYSIFAPVRAMFRVAMALFELHGLHDATKPGFAAQRIQPRRDLDL